jgi:hypothetical protein
MKASEAFWILVFIAVAFIAFAPKVTQDIETHHRNELAQASYPGCGNRDCECYADCTCIDGDCICGGPKPPVPPKPKPKPKPEPDIPPDDIGPELKAASTKEIILHARANCPPCDLWWANERPKFEAAGWKIAIHSLSSTDNGRAPFFTIQVDGKQIELQGYQTFENVKRVMR